jgi:alkaline phosphatase
MPPLRMRKSFLLSLVILLFPAFLSAQKPKNIILLIGDGMGLTQIQAAYFQNNMQLSILGMPVSGLHQTRSADDLITDSGAGGTAIACGVKTYNGAIGVDTNKQAVQSILELAELKGLSTGLIATSSITHATPASFAAHVSSRADDEGIALQMSQSGVDFIAGGGLSYFNQRKDNKNLVLEMQGRGYKMFTSGMPDTNSISPQTAYLLDPGHLPRVEKRGPFLEMASVAAIKSLETDPEGFFLMIEGSQIDWGGHANSRSYVVSELLDFDKAVEAALRFAEADGNTLVIVTADHETGGLTLIAPGKKASSQALNAHFSTRDHSAVMVPVFAYGPGAEMFTGVYQNTELFTKMKQAFGW